MSVPAFYQPGSMVTFSIQSGGATIPDSINVISVTIEKRLNQLFSAQFVLLDGNPGTGDFEISSSGLFVPGNTITINAGYNGRDSRLFEGKVTSQNISIKGMPPLRSLLIVAASLSKVGPLTTHR